MHRVANEISNPATYTFISAFKNKNFSFLVNVVLHISLTFSGGAFVFDDFMCTKLM